MIRFLFVVLSLFTMVTPALGDMVVHSLSGGTPPSCVAYDYTSWTEQDSGNDLTVASDTLTLGAGFEPRQETYYVYTDLGVGALSGDFHFRGSFQIDTVDDNYLFTTLWAVTNDIGDWYFIDNNAHDGIAITTYSVSGTKRLRLVEQNGNVSTYGESDFNFVLSTTYYWDLFRDNDAGTFGTVTLKIYDDAAYTEPANAEILLSLTEQQDFRYLYGVQGFDDNNKDNEYKTGSIGELCKY